MQKISVKNSGEIRLQTFDDRRDGRLFIGEAMKNVPLKIKRFYFINGLMGKKSVRGRHAHRKLEQCIFCLHGSFVLTLDDGARKQTVTLDDPACGVRLGRMLWHSMSGFSKDCVILVVTDDYYKESDYIRNYEDFIQQVKAGKR